jgi:hypothetical protein
MLTALLALAAIALAGSEPDHGDPIVFPSAAVAFQKGVEACEGLYSGAYSAERSNPDGLGPFSRRGFYMSGSGDEAKVDMLMLSQKSHVYKATVSGEQGVVYLVLTDSLRICRVGSFDSAQSHAAALATLTDPNSGWLPQPTTSSSASAQMQMFEKDLGSWSAVLNVSWPNGPRTGPNGLTAMATMAANPKRAAPVQ